MPHEYLATFAQDVIQNWKFSPRILTGPVCARHTWSLKLCVHALLRRFVIWIRYIGCIRAGASVAFNGGVCRIAV
jgi:hypothetical protein